VIRREIGMMAQSASCPQMTRYFSSQVVGTFLHIVMEYMGGGALSDLVQYDLLLDLFCLSLLFVVRACGL
jgi:serine/threonine protein kinase